MQKVKYFFPAIFWGMVVLILLSLPGSYIPHIVVFTEWLQWDKISHLILFGVFSYAMLWGFYKSHTISKAIYGLVFLLSVLFGGLTEYLQYLLDIGRNGNIYDFCANCLGVGLGCFVFFLKTKKVNK